MTDDLENAAAVAEIAKAVAPKTMHQADRLGEDVLKTVRLILAPLQMTAAWQDRLSSYIQRAVRQVPEGRAITPAESIALPIAEKLRFQEVENPITDLYINLLSRAMDGERVGEAHPAFFTVISQLAPDEIIFLKEVSSRDQSIIMCRPGEMTYPSAESRLRRFEEFHMPPQLVDRATSMMFRYEDLNQPEMFPVFQEHLQHLGLIEFYNQLGDIGKFNQRRTATGGLNLQMFSIRLTNFGNLFFKACINE